LGRKPVGRDVPQSLIDWLVAWHERPLNANPLQTVGGERVIAPVIVQMTDEAERISDAFEVEMHETKKQARDRHTDALFVRARENALKFALVWACSAPPIYDATGRPIIDESSLIVTGEIMRWACELSRVTITAMEKNARDNIADGQFGQRVKDVRDAIARARERGMTLSEIGRTSAGKLPSRDFADVIAHLTSTGLVFQITTKPVGAGRPRTALVHKDFVEQ